MNNTQKKFIMLVVLIMGCILTSVVGDLISKYNDEKEDKHSLSQEVENREVQIRSPKKTIRIYVSGAVVKPGLYDVPFDSRADTAVNIAGGFTEYADKDRVNIARKLKDGAQVNVPTKKLQKTISKNKENVIKSKTLQKEVAKQDLSLNINTASVEEMQKLPGIGPAMAKRIVSAREEAKFTSVNELLRVKGIGKAKLERIREYVRAE